MGAVQVHKVTLAQSFQHFFLIYNLMIDEYRQDATLFQARLLPPRPRLFLNDQNGFSPRCWSGGLAFHQQRLHARTAFRRDGALLSAAWLLRLSRQVWMASTKK